MEIKAEQGYGFEEVYLIPNRCVVGSRDECDQSVVFGNRTFRNGVIPANMASVVSTETCMHLMREGMFYIMHRFSKFKPWELVNIFQAVGEYASISVGVNEESINDIKDIVSNGLSPEYITVDIANVYSPKGEYMIKFIKDVLPETFVIAGNCATPEAVIDLESYGADATKLGIAQGLVCSTYMATGFGRPQFTTVLECAKVAKKPIISDGGIRNIGDFSKAFVAGATMVMAGSMFAGYDQSAGDVVHVGKEKYKQYFGSASYSNTRSRKNVEGESILIPYKGNMNDFLFDVDNGIRSGISYAGGIDMSAFNHVQWGVRNGGVR